MPPKTVAKSMAVRTYFATSISHLPNSFFIVLRISWLQR